MATITPEIIRSYARRARDGAKRADITRAAVWLTGALFGLAIWACAIWGAWDIGARAMQWLMRDVGSLNGCVERGLVGGECSAWALEGL